ncbi:hypothetical protein [Mycobacterium sp. Marseille-P9652]|uniref:hypothetical protein n=1 Tax=Mycobacterium sp. Marseille-P9652 TaxID=2654950 RepID=UPI0012E73BDA|nr:hypothetical protein [Mycobacterium sp. Marseille-P9652]
MTRLRFAALAAVTAIAPVAVVAGTGVAQARGAHAGDTCSVLHATTMGPDGETLTCNPTMTTNPATGQPTLVWQMGGPA